MAEKNPGQSEAVRGIRDIYESYQSLYSINPKQDPGFFIQYLEQVFELEENIGVKVENAVGGDKRDPENETLDSIRTVYNVYKTLCKYNLKGASAILMQNLGEILSKVEEEPKSSDVKMEFSPKEVKSDLNIKIVMTQSLSAENDDASQCQDANKESVQDEISIPASPLYIKEEAEVENEQEEQTVSIGDETNTSLNYKCSTCSQFFQDKSVMKNHSQLHKLEKNAKDSLLCKFCKKSFPRLNLRNIHEGFCSESSANKKTNSSSLFKERDLSPNGSSSSPTKSTTNEKVPLTRKSVTRKPKYNKFMCVYCDRKLSSAAALVIHKRIHTGESPFPCLKCSRKFTRKDYLKRHVQISHADEPDLNKETPKYSTRQQKSSTSNSAGASSSLGWPLIKTEHDEDEEDEGEATEDKNDSKKIIELPIRRKLKHKKGFKIKHFESKSCSSASTSKSQKPSKKSHCNLCDKTFLNRAYLTGHVMGHVKQEEKKKPKFCSICKEKFGSVESRWAHQKKAHMIDQSFHCTICKTKFKSSYTLVAHLNVTHS